MMAAIESFLAIVPAELAKGNIVELGDFDSFWLRADSEGAETAEEVRADQIGSVLPRFNPRKEFKRVLDTVKFNRNQGSASPLPKHGDCPIGQSPSLF